MSNIETGATPVAAQAAKSQTAAEKAAYIADLQGLAFKAVQDYCNIKGITQGLTKGAHAGAMAHALVDVGLLPEEAKLDAFYVLCALENGSQLRQELEKAGTLGRGALLTNYAP